MVKKCNGFKLDDIFIMFVLMIYYKNGDEKKEGIKN